MLEQFFEDYGPDNFEFDYGVTRSRQRALAQGAEPWPSEIWFVVWVRDLAEIETADDPPIQKLQALVDAEELPTLPRPEPEEDVRCLNALMEAVKVKLELSPEGGGVAKVLRR